MRKLMHATLVASSVIMSCQRSQPEQQSSSANTAGTPQVAAASVIEIKVPTIQCKNCVRNIEAALKNVEGVQSAKVDLAGKITTVGYDGSKLGLADLEKVITAAGYEANDKKRDAEAYDMLDACCKEPKDGGGH